MALAKRVWCYGDSEPTEDWPSRSQHPEEAALTFAKSRWNEDQGEPKVQKVNVRDDFGNTYVFEVTAKQETVFFAREIASATSGCRLR